MQGLQKNRRTGMVYTMTNTAPRNKVVAFHRDIDGKLTPMRAYSTGGSGTGEKKVDPLSSQGSLILSRIGNFLFTVNAGGNSISSFHVANNGVLTLINVKPSGGVKPNSLAMHGNLLYVTNAGNTANDSNITGFRVLKDGSLSRINGSKHTLSMPSAQPSCVVFSPNGCHLVVSELNTNRLSVFRVNRDGTLHGPTINKSSGTSPFGSTFLSKGLLLVSEAGPNALSSYLLAANGNLSVISGSVRNGQLATCWVSASRNGDFAYTSDAGSGTISIYRIRNNGTLSYLQSVNSTRTGTAAPLDSCVSRDGSNFYVLNGNKGSISTFRIRNNGNLLRLQVVTDSELPVVGAQGLAVR